MEETEQKTKGDYFVPALQKGLLILEMFTRERNVLSVNDFAKRLGVSASTIYRTVVTLTEMGYLIKTGRNNYSLGSRVLSNGFTFLASRGIVEVAAPYLLKLRDESSASCHLMVRDGVEVIYLYRAASPQRLAVNVPVGTRLDCHATAGGRALLMGLAPEELSELYSGVALDQASGHSPASLPLLKQLLQEEELLGYSISRSDSATAIGVPLINYAGEYVAAINVSAPDTLMGNEEIRSSMISLLQKTAEEISQELGNPGVKTTTQE